LSRLTTKEFTGKILMEVEDGPSNRNKVLNNKRDQEAGFENTLDRFERNFTNRSDDPSTILMFSRPSGARPAFVEQILPNTNEKYYETMDLINTSKIIQAHSWSSRLLGGNANAYFSTNVYIDEIKTKDTSVIPSLRNVVQSIVHTAIDFVVKIEERIDIEGFQYSFKSPYLHFIEKEKKYSNEIIDDTTGAAQ
jgi:hypothetical protein